jgi:hypothetical protein
MKTRNKVLHLHFKEHFSLALVISLLYYFNAESSAKIPSRCKDYECSLFSFDVGF